MYTIFLNYTHKYFYDQHFNSKVIFIIIIIIY